VVVVMVIPPGSAGRWCPGSTSVSDADGLRNYQPPPNSIRPADLGTVQLDRPPSSARCTSAAADLVAPG